MPNLARRKSSSVVLVALILATTMPDLAAGSVRVTPPQTRCFVTIGDAHISTYIGEKSGQPAVKVNAQSKCKFSTDNLFLTVEIFKKGRFMRIYSVVKKDLSIQRVMLPDEVIEFKETYRLCKNRISTSYFGVISARIRIIGRSHQTLKVRSEHDVSLACGT
ncbi:unannotated protein [freshwater metagenome]|uniref:Unannotated protein n=1 Tax=freshwater metagenome TaxID=449393 RepID=A0A6J6CJN0_9ZZZZ